MSIGRSVNVYVKNMVDQKPIAGARAPWGTKPKK